MTTKNYNIPRCPYCRSLNITPIGTKLWHCGDCNKDFTEAVVEQEPTEPKKKGE